MAKRKAQNDPDDSTDTIVATLADSQESNRLSYATPTKTRKVNDGSAKKTGSATSIVSSNNLILKDERRKKISSTFSDLSQIGDINNQTTDSKSNIVLTQKCGYIEKISLKHFKCHDYLEFSLHPYINFILGRNGSGKSAVMDAIILCLGGKTTATGRQASAKTFIKTNFDKAELSVSLKNEGDDAYKPELYGSKIIIERKISKDGASQYKMFNENYKLISIKKSELDNIMEQFNIQVDNPVCFLNQETSKHFLNSSNKNDKYKLFMKASQLESMKILQEQIEVERQAAKSLIEDKKSYLPKLEEELYFWEQKYKRCQSVEKLRKNLNLLMNEYSWAYVIFWEKELEETQKTQRIIFKSKEKHLAKLEEAENMNQQANVEFEKVKADIAELNKLIKGSSSGNKQEELAANLKKAQTSFKAKDGEKKKLTIQLERKTKDKSQLEQKLNDEKKNSQNNYDKERQDKEDKIAELTQKIKDIKNSEKTKQQDNHMFTNTIDDLQKKIREKNYEIQSESNKIKDLESDIDRLNNASKNQILRYGNYMAELVNDVKKAYDMKKFRQLPRGPIGMYLQPNNYKWALAIEQAISPAFLTTFICANHEDEALMHQLINKHIQQINRKPRVVVTDFNARLHDHKKYRPEFESHPTVYEMVTFKDTIVANTLFDLRKIESILLLPDLKVGEEIIAKQSTQICNEAYLRNGDRLLGFPTYRVYPCHQREPQFLCENVQSVIDAKKSEIEKIKMSIAEKREEIKKLENEVNSNRDLKSKNDKILESYRKEIYNLSSKLKDAENIHIPEPADLMFYEEEINKLEREIECIRPKIESLEEELVTLKEDYDKALKESNEFDKEKRVYDNKIDDLKTKYNECDQERNTSKDAVNHYKKLLNDVLVKEKEVNDKIDMQQGEIDKLKKAAEDLCQRINTKRTKDVILGEINAIENQIQQSEKLHGNEEEITKNYNDRKDKFFKIKKDIDKQSKFLSKLKKALEERGHKMHMFTEGKALRCSIDFTNYLNSRNFKGTLQFDHTNLTLDIVVHPNKSKDSKESKDLKSLSGGERSYSTVAFLLALWSIVESPILFLDEFDVFMDQINRNFAMELIVNAAKEKFSGQYVFLTPQEMGTIKPDEYVKMFKMPDPRRAIDMHNNNSNQNDE